MFDCACDMDDEGYTVQNMKTIKARKVHSCCECGDKIKPKDTYNYFTGLYDGKWESYKICKTCMTIHNDFQCIPFSQLKNYLVEYGFDRDQIF